MVMNNNNTTLEICVNNLNFDKFLHISDIIWRLFGFIGIMIGIPGNVFQIIISSKKTNHKQAISLYFIAISICDLIFLIGAFWLWCANMLFIKTDPRDILSCGIFYSILVGSTTLSNLYLALMSIDRSIMILCPIRYRLFATRSRVLLRLILFFLIIFLLQIPHHFYLYYNPKTTLFLCDFNLSINYGPIRLWSLTHAIFFVSIPSLIVCISSLILLNNRCKYKRIYKNKMSKNARRMQRRSILIVFISIGLFLSLLPMCILEIYMIHDRFIYYNMYCSIRWEIYKILLNCFLTLASINYSTKFYIHLMISPSFRKDFIQFIICKFNQNSNRSTKMDSKNNNEQHLLSSFDQNKTKWREI